MRVSNRIRPIMYRRRYTSLTVGALAEITGESLTAVANALKRMPDTYIHEWVLNDYGKHVAGWRIAIPPNDAPRPTPRSKKPTSGEKICD